MGFRLGSRKVRRYKNTWIRNSSDAMAQQEWKVVRRRRSSEGCNMSASPMARAATQGQDIPTRWDNLWNDAWRHQNRLRTSISGEYEELTLVANSSDQPAKHPRSNIRLGKEGAEAGEPH